MVALEVIQEAIDAGIRHIAENRVQEAENKFPLLVAKNPQIKCHIIGHLQTNKAKDAIKVCSLIQSVDSFKLAQEIEKQAAKTGQAVEILVQFNSAREEQKFGATPGCGCFDRKYQPAWLCSDQGTDGHGALYRRSGDYPQNIFRFAGYKGRYQGAFCRTSRVDMGILSMGMSSDYKIAIEEGSTMVRIGSAIFKEGLI